MAKNPKNTQKTTPDPVTDPNPTPETPDEEWVTPSRAREKTGLSAQRIRYLGEQGDVKRRKADKGWEYLLSDLEEFKPGSSGGEPEIVSLELVHYRNSAKRLEAKSEYLDGLQKDMLEWQGGQLKEYRDRVAQHESQRLDLMKAIEELLSIQHERDLAEKKLENSMQMRKQALEIFGEAFKPLSQQVGQWIGAFVPDSPMAKGAEIVGAVVMMTNKMRPKLEMLLQTEMLDEEEKEMIKSLLESVPKPPDTVDTEGQTAGP